MCIGIGISKGTDNKPAVVRIIVVTGHDTDDVLAVMIGSGIVNHVELGRFDLYEINDFVLVDGFLVG